MLFSTLKIGEQKKTITTTIGSNAKIDPGQLVTSTTEIYISVLRTLGLMREQKSKTLPRFTRC